LITHQLRHDQPGIIQATGALRLAGHFNIAAGTRDHARHPRYHAIKRTGRLNEAALLSVRESC